MVFEHLLVSDKRFIVEQGGTRSGKTFNILLWIIFVYLTQNTRKVVTIVRRSGTALRGSVMRDFFTILQDYDLYKVEDHNKTSSEYRFNGNLIEFVSLDEPQKIRGRKRDLLYINEANELAYEDFFQLNVRTLDRVVLDYNPSEEFHWIYDKVVPREDAEFHITTYLDNPFLDERVVAEIERLKDTDEIYWSIYGLGQKAQSRATIFQFGQVPQVPENIKFLGYGLDWGYTNDPTAIVGVWQDGDSLYFEEMVYEAGLTNWDIVNRIKAFELKGVVYADSAEPKSIDEIHKFGINIKPAKKGKDSVNHGIDLMRRHRLFWHEKSINGVREMRNYKWQEDKNGRLTNQPIDAYNHLIDAARYCVTMALGNPNYGRYSIG